MPNSSEAVRKAREHAQRKFTLALEQIANQGNEELRAERERQAARSSLPSGAMLKFVADHLVKRIEALMRAKLTTTLDAYELYGAPIDDEMEHELLQEIRSMREAQITNGVNYASSQRDLGEQAASYVNGRLTSMTSFQNEAKVEIAERRQKQLREHQSAIQRASNDSLVFVSCGQSTPAERELGKAIAKLVEQETGCHAYFAENQTNLKGVTENILKKLHDAVGFIAIMHPRGDVSNPHNKSDAWVRGSVWVEQEVAIAAFINQALQRPIQVRAYVHQSIRREGLRDKLHLNPVEFVNDSEILTDLEAFLPGWRSLAGHQPKQGMSLKPVIKHQRVSIPGGGDAGDERHLLQVSIENDGTEDARDYQLDVYVPNEIADENGSVLLTSSDRPGFVLFRITNTHHQIAHLYPGNKTPDIIQVHYWVRGKDKQASAEFLQKSVTARVSSGNMQPKAVTKTVAELLG